MITLTGVQLQCYIIVDVIIIIMIMTANLSTTVPDTCTSAKFWLHGQVS